VNQVSQCQYYPKVFICRSETWLSSKTPDDEIKIENYTLYRHDRDSDCGYGGVCIYASNSLKSKRNLTDESDGS
jgi:hypothetical protein